MPTLTVPEATYRRLAEQATGQNTTVDELAARLLAGEASPPAPPGGVFDFLEGLPAVVRSPDEWAEFDRTFLEQRAAWGR